MVSNLVYKTMKLCDISDFLCEDEKWFMEMDPEVFPIEKRDDGAEICIGHWHIHIDEIKLDLYPGMMLHDNPARDFEIIVTKEPGMKREEFIAWIYGAGYELVVDDFLGSGKYTVEQIENLMCDIVVDESEYWTDEVYDNDDD